MPRAVVSWRGKEFASKIEKKLARNIRIAALKLENSIKKAFPGGPSRSEDFQIPHSQTGAAGLLGSITNQRVERLAYAVGSTLKPGQGGTRGKHSYAWYLEKGTKRMKKRPWLRPALKREKPMIAKTIGSKGVSGI